MPELHSRTQILIGSAALAHLRAQHVLIAGLGGVGGYVAENLARAGIGCLTLLDKDCVATSNLNRQLVALQSTVGQTKTKVMAARINDIDPRITLHLREDFINTENAGGILQSIHQAYPLHYVADCIDTLACKAQLVFSAQILQLPVFSAMGAGNRVDVREVRVSTLQQTQTCPLAREMRRRLRQLGGELNYPVVYSEELPRTPLAQQIEVGEAYHEKAVNGTISYMPAILGVLMAGEIVRRLLPEEWRAS